MHNLRFMRTQAIFNALPIFPQEPITLMALASKPSVQAYLPEGSSPESIRKLLRKDLLWLEQQFGPDVQVEESGNGRPHRYRRTPQAQWSSPSVNMQLAFMLNAWRLRVQMPPEQFAELEREINLDQIDHPSIRVLDKRLRLHAPIWRPRPVDPEVYQTVYDAIQQRRSLQLTLAPTSGTEDRQHLCLHPVGLVFDQFGRTLVGVDENGNGKSYALVTVRQASLLGPAPAEVEERHLHYFSGVNTSLEALGIFEPAIWQDRWILDLQLRLFSDRAKKLAESCLMVSDEEFEHLPDGSLLMTNPIQLRAEHLDELLDWLVSWAPELTVMSPDWLASAVEQRLWNGLWSYLRSS